MPTKTAKYTYFYISDHLGSTSMVSDADGNISQSVSYIPYGEVFVEENSGAWNSPYLFNAKELDLETGFYYYGARYLNPTSGMWLSVDPLFEKYAGMSPYQYCHNNPINKVDVDGRFDTEDEVWHFCWDNEVNGRASQRFDGTYEIYDEFSKATYYHDREGVLNTDLPEYVVEGKRNEPQPTFIDNVTNAYVSTMESADDWANDVLRPIVQGTALFHPVISIANSGKTLITGDDIYGNKADSFDKFLSILDFITLGYGKYLKIMNKSSNVNTFVDKSASIGSVLKTSYTEYTKQ